MVTFTQLPQDIIDEILLVLPNFNTLAAALRSSKYILNGFKNHPSSIVKSIAYSIVGPALPQAVRLAHCRATSDYEVGESLLDEAPLTRDICEALENHVEVVSKLEDLFSQRHKDRRCRTSQLTDEESARFRRALYRVWLYNTAMHDMEDDDTELQEWIQTELTLLPEQDLFDLHRAFLFVLEVNRWSWTAAEIWLDTPPAPDASELDLGLDQVVAAYEESVNGNVEGDLEITLAEEIGKIWCMRTINDEKREAETAKAIVKFVNGAEDACNRCKAIKGVHLWGHSNAHLLRGFITVMGLTKMLEGNLWKNQVEMGPFKTTFHDRDPNGMLTFNWTLFVEEILSTDDGVEGPLDASQWYCHDCVLSLLRSRLRKWWIAQKVKNGAPLLQDCWYGYNCRTQVHRPAHAAKLNHLCEPTRGDRA